MRYHKVFVGAVDELRPCANQLVTVVGEQLVDVAPSAALSGIRAVGEQLQVSKNLDSLW